MPRKRVVLFEFPILPDVVPLAAGYLQTMACLNPRVRDTYIFETCVYGVFTEKLLDIVLSHEAEIYGFSTYVWNVGLVRVAVERLVALRPGVQIILGGPQVMQNAETYLQSSRENVVLCNGEGEHTFSAYLAELLEEEPDFSRVCGLSFYKNNVLITTEVPPRIRDLNEIPSPFLEGVLDVSEFGFAAFETNRGCPFKCTYCFWGGATNAKVHKFGIERILDELTWLSERKIKYLFIVDANFGILERDVDIARHLVECKRRTGFPHQIFINSSKNTPGRVTEITKMWAEVGLIAAQPVSIQTVSPKALKAIERDNIKSSTYTELQSTLTANGLQSFLEMIWPLPGETLQSFEEGLDELCRMESDSFIVYPLMLISNVEMAKQRNLYKLETIVDKTAYSEAEIVVSTIDVSRDDYKKGVNLTYHMAVLYTFLGLRHTMVYLDAMGVRSFIGVAKAFWQFCIASCPNPYADYILAEEASTENDAAGGAVLGGAIHIALHSGAKEFDQLLHGFVEQEGWLVDPMIRLRFEVDLLNRPLIYTNSPALNRADLLEIIKILHVGKDSVRVEVPTQYAGEVRRMLSNWNVGLDAEHAGPGIFEINYRSAGQMVYDPRKPELAYRYACQSKLRGEIRPIAPKWSVVQRPDVFRGSRDVENQLTVI